MNSRTTPEPAGGERGRLPGLTRRLVRLVPVYWVAFLAALIAFFLTREQGELRRLNRVVRTARLDWLLVAVAVECAIVVLMAFEQQLLLRRLRARVGLLLLLEIFFRRQLLATVLPFGNVTSNVQFVRALGRRNIETGDALFASILFSVLGTVSLAIFAVPVLLWLAVERQVSRAMLAGSGLLLVVVMLLGVAGWMLLRGAGPLEWAVPRIPDRIGAFVAQTRAHGVTVRDLRLPFGLALAIDVLGGAMLYAVLRSLAIAPSPSAAFGGYLIGTIFVLVAPVFQGLGFVELSMAVALRRFGVPAAAALGATLLYRFCELWLPFVVGLAIQSSTSRGVRALPPRLPAIVTSLTGLLSILSVVGPSFPHRFDRVASYSRLAPAEASRTLTLVAGSLLIFLSFSLLRRRRIAWIAALGLLSAVTVTHLLKRHDEVVALVAGTNAALLVIYRERFRVRSDIPTIAQGFVRLCLALAVTIAYGTVGFWFLDERDFGIEFSLWDAWERTFRLLFGLDEAGLHPRTHHAAWFLGSFDALAVVALAYAAFVLIRPVVWRATTLPAERQRARRLIERYGDSALDFFKSWDDKYFFFASDPNDGVVAFGVALGTAIALGDPVARDAATFERLLDDFLDFCDANGWRVAFHQCSPTHLASYRQRGLSALKIGEDAIVDLTTFSLSGGHRKGLRSAVNKLARDGFTAVYHEPPLADALLRQLREVSDDWLRIAGRRERGFTLGSFRDDYLRNGPVMTVEDAGGAVAAFANLIPDGVAGEATIDLMRRREDAPGGIMDFLFVRLLEYVRDTGYTRFSLGMAPFAAVGIDEGAPVIERGLHLLSEHLTRFFSYKGLRDYKDKFGPSWEPRYLVYRSEVSLPVIALALVRLTEPRHSG